MSFENADHLITDTFQGLTSKSGGRKAYWGAREMALCSRAGLAPAEDRVSSSHSRASQLSVVPATEDPLPFASMGTCAHVRTPTHGGRIKKIIKYLKEAY